MTQLTTTRKQFRVLLTLLLLQLFLTGARADGGPETMISYSAYHGSERITVGVEAGEYYPHYDDSSGEYAGFGRDLLDAFAEYADLELIYRVEPLKRLVESALSGSVELRYPDNPYWEADQKLDRQITYSEPIVSYVDGTLVLPARLGNPLTSSFRLGTVAGFTPWPYFDLIDSGEVTLRENSSRTGLLHQALLGRLDGVYMSLVVANYQLTYKLKQPGALVFDPRLPFKKSHYFLSSVTRPDLVRKFNEFLQQRAEQVAVLKQHYRVEEGLDFIPEK